MTKALPDWHSKFAIPHLVLRIGRIVVGTTQFRLHRLHNPMDLTSARVEGHAWLRDTSKRNWAAAVQVLHDRQLRLTRPAVGCL